MRTTASHVDVRRAGPDDAATVLAMVREIAALAGRGGPGHPRDLGGDARPPRGDRAGRRARRRSGRVRLRRPPAAPWLGTDILALDDLYVREGYRDAGVGRLLMHELAALADGMLIRWEVREDNVAAQRFYRRLGASLRTKVIAWWRP